MIKKQQGYGLVEVIIGLAIVGIISAIAYTSYQSHILKARRTDAVQTLLSMQLAEENYRTNNTAYGDLDDVWSGETTTGNGFYTLTITNLSGTSYTLTATATGSQTADNESGTACSPLSIAMNNGTETKSPAACWAN